MSALKYTAATREKALEEALEDLDLPEEALDLKWAEEDEDLLAGAHPMVEVSVTVKADWVAEEACDVLEELLEKMHIDAELTYEVESGMAICCIESDQGDRLIGYHGETLDALQYLVTRMSGLGGRDMPLILVDVDDYRRKRLDRLRKITKELSEDVRKTGKEEWFDPMDSMERKLVHTFVKEEPGVRSYSRGEGAERQVIVAPEE